MTPQKIEDFKRYLKALKTRRVGNSKGVKGKRK